MQQTGIFIEPPDTIISGVMARQEAFRLRLLKLQQPVSALPPVSLLEMGKVRLMNRTDLKFLVPEKTIPLLLESLADKYCIQEVDGKRVAEYETHYLDTEDLIFFHTHVNGKLNRFKWRVRTYLDSDLTFLEMKFKSNKGRTEKKRIPYNALIGLIDPSVSAFIAQNSGISSENLSPVLQNKFNRITLVNIGKTERLTIDLNITYRNSVNGVQVSLNNLAIIELKQDKTVKSTASEIFNGMRIKQTGVSKYCLGMALTSPLVKGNIYKQKIRQITKILNQQ
jgi:hypothetical protein